MTILEDARSWRRVPLTHRVANMTTRSLERASGRLRDGTEGSVVVKTLQPASASTLFQNIPPEFQDEVLRELNWLDEPRVYRSGLAAAMPEGLRLPVLYGVDEASDSIALWIEDVDDVAPWNIDRYRRSAAALGRLGVRWPGDSAARGLGMGPRPIAGLFFGKVTNYDLTIQADDAFWSSEIVGPVVDSRHRADLFRLAELMPSMISSLDTLPTGLCHGDAAPDNLREPGDGSIVAIDWSYGHIGPLGSDLGQLLVGRFDEAREGLEPEGIATAIIDGFLEGIGDASGAASVERAWATHLAIRSVFGALLLDRPDLSEAEKAVLLARRARVARFGLDLALRYATAHA